jgi:hypothetical protein
MSLDFNDNDQSFQLAAFAAVQCALRGFKSFDQARDHLWHVAVGLGIEHKVPEFDPGRNRPETATTKEPSQ